MLLCKRPLLLGLLLTVSLLATACGSQPSSEANPAADAKQTSAQNSSAAETASGEESSAAASGQTSGSDASASAVVYPRTVKHALGETTLDKQPERVYAPYMEDALLTLGVKPVLKWSLGPLVQEYLEPQLRDVPKIDFSAGENSEQILAAQPDLIVLYSSEMGADGAYERDAKIAPTYVFQDAAGDWKGTLSELGDLLGKTAEADRAIADYDALVTRARSELAPIVEGKTFATIRIKPKEITLMDGTYFSGATLYGDLGLTPHPMVKEQAWENFITLSMEALPDLDADYIFYTVQGEDAKANADRVLGSELWKNLPAVKAGHAYPVENNYWLAAGAIANRMQIEDVLRLVKP
ncbi:ferrichrome ABC transporter substrate-binding protein [Saccharibacillus sp. O23]|uniref:ABC transporter substrate-binding protein n=1 Tax=Saccharibacillus sp. O23 TaxID=2009338 RepID=UPI000B4DF5C0|nr:ABC transporter substrate-binding protein [Saccharibacillus sp. O23]OWR30755.1 ferrichrome ABC transporter substrate-binding protein [Saccharibacillus sp. O23]